jgi:hypothetical protein
VDPIDTAITAADQWVPLQQAINFKMFTGLLKAYETADGTKIIRGVASSTVSDHNGDLIEKSAIDDMVAAANNNMTIFLNHSYNVPEDVAGSVRDARAAMMGMSPDGEIWDMGYDVAVDDTNPRALSTWRSIKERGTKLGLSIGAKIPEGGASINKKTGRYRFQHLELLETSIVGLPANPRSWISSVLHSLHPTDGEESVVINDLALAAMCGAPCEGGTCKKPAGHDGDHSSYSASTEPEIVASDDPTEDPGETPEPTTDPASPDEGETDSSQGAPASEPESEPAPEAVTQTESMTAALFTEMSQTLNAVSQELTLTRSERDAAIKERDEANKKRDDVIKASDELIIQTAHVVELVASIPLGRKAVLKEAQDSLSHLTRVYGEDMLKRMRGEND